MFVTLPGVGAGDPSMDESAEFRREPMGIAVSRGLGGDMVGRSFADGAAHSQSFHKTLISLKEIWSGRGDSNARPQPWQGECPRFLVTFVVIGVL